MYAGKSLGKRARAAAHVDDEVARSETVELPRKRAHGSSSSSATAASNSSKRRRPNLLASSSSSATAASDSSKRHRPNLPVPTGENQHRECQLLVLPTALVEHVLSFLPPMHLAKTRPACSALCHAATTAAHVQALRVGLQSDWQECHRLEFDMPKNTQALHLLWMVGHRRVARFIKELRGPTAKLACARINEIPANVISDGATLLADLLVEDRCLRIFNEFPSVNARAGALNAFARASVEVICRFAPVIELRLQDEAEFVRLAALNVLGKLPTPVLAQHLPALEACRDDVRNHHTHNGGFVFRAVRATLGRLGNHGVQFPTAAAGTIHAAVLGINGA
eukprot:jgi/Chrpa1/18311/Chrysochromulina_OHIO_Genome00004164-RA